MLGGTERFSPIMSTEKPELREYKAIVWAKDPNAIGQRVTYMAENLEHARELMVQQFGEDVICTLWNEEDAHRPRQPQ